MNNRIKSRYLRVVLLSLLFLLTAGQLNAKMIYFENNINWSNVKVHMWGNATGDVDMSPTGDGKWYSAEIDDNAKDLQFYNGYWNDNNQTGNLSYPTDGKNAFVWNGEGGWKGYWITYNPTPVEQTYYLKHNWGNKGGTWPWKQLTKSEDGDTYYIVDYYGGSGCNWNTSASDTGSKWVASPTLVGSPANGDECTFTLDPTAGTITITKNAPVVTQVATPTFTPAGGEYEAAQSVTIACATEGATIYYTTDGNDPTTSSNQYTGAIAVNETTTLKAIAAKDGMDNSEVASATYTINIPTPTVPVVKIHGGLAIDESNWNANGIELDNNDGVYEYTFTKRSNAWNNYFFVTIDGKRIQETNEGNNKEVVLNTTYTWKENIGNSAQFYIKDGILTNGNSYTVVINTNDNTICVNGNTAPITISEVYIFGGLDINVWNDANEQGKKMTNAGDGVFTYEFTYNADGNKYWAFKAKNSEGAYNFLRNDANTAIALGGTASYAEHDSRSGISYYCNDIATGGKYLITLDTNNKTVTIKCTGGITNEIPVYPRGVQSETELEAYDFASNPVVYLMSNMLNNNRISPEWQMISDGNGRFHLNGFAARTASDYKVRVYTSATSYVESASVSIDCNDGNASLAEGKLYNASVALNEGNYVLTLTEDENANGRMPFISLVGYAMKQDQEYKTPRAFEGHPSDVTTDKGWQEAWLQYDENGKIVKDRNGNVMYSTMWPPRNPIYFTANIGGERLYSSEQMTFKAQNNYEAKTGAEWKAELLAGENGEAYENLGNGEYKLQDNVEYVRYVVPDIWYVGSAKVWTGWNGEAYNNNGWKAMWSHHANWGYENKRATDEDGTDVVAEQPYYLSTDDNYNGNFKFDNPTYFKTIEFFYNTANRNESRLYTTLAFGKAQIEAQSHKDGDTYDYGQYRPSVDVPAGNTVKDYTIRCYDAATGELVTLNGGVVASGEGNPSKDFFQKEELGLAEGKYYFELEVTFQDGAGNTRKSVVKSNPFIIHFPGVYTLEPVALQLVKMDDAYVTYNKNTENAPLFRATINENNELTAVAPVAESERTALFAKFESNTGFNWTDKVLVVAPVPAQFKLDAEKPNATLAITDYTLNTSLQVAKAKDGSMAYLDNTGKFTDKVYTAVMNYKETVEDEQTDKQSMAKPASALMMRPNPKTDGEVVVTVSQPGTIGSESTIDGMAVPADAQYYTVSVEMPFGAANVTEDASAPKYIAVMGDQNAELSQAGTVTFNNVDPLTFVNDIKVTAVYPDGDNNFTLEANVGDPVSCNSETDGFKKYAQITLSDFVPVFNSGQAGVRRIFMTVPDDTRDNISNENLEMQYFKAQAFLGNDKKEVLNSLLTAVQLNIEDYIKVGDVTQTALRFNVDDITLTEKMPASMKVTPVYFVKVNESISVPGNGAAQAPALKADANEATYVALYGNEAEISSANGIVTGVNDITVDGVKAYKVIENGQVIIVRGDARFNIMGQPVR